MYCVSLVRPVNTFDFCHFDLLSEYSCCFPAWVNQNYNAAEILFDPEYCTYNYLYELWEEEVISDINSGWFYELQPMEDTEND